MNRDEKARELFAGGMNCAQAVLLAFSDKTGLDDETAAAISAGMGGGVGRLRDMCGAVSGAVLALGLIKGSPKDKHAKTALYSDVQKIAFSFEKELGSYLCGPLLGEEGPADPEPEPRTPGYHAQRPCERCVGCAARLLDELLSR